MRISLLFLLCSVGLSMTAQTVISGKVMDKKKTPLLGANVYLDGTYDGATTNENGEFSFETFETGVQTLVVSFVSYIDYVSVQDVSTFNNLEIVLKEDVNTLDAVTLSANATYLKTFTHLKPLSSLKDVFKEVYWTEIKDF